MNGSVLRVNWLRFYIKRHINYKHHLMFLLGKLFSFSVLFNLKIVGVTVFFIATFKVIKFSRSMNELQ